MQKDNRTHVIEVLGKLGFANIPTELLEKLLQSVTAGDAAEKIILAHERVRQEWHAEKNSALVIFEFSLPNGVSLNKSDLPRNVAVLHQNMDGSYTIGFEVEGARGDNFQPAAGTTQAANSAVAAVTGTAVGDIGVDYCGRYYSWNNPNPEQQPNTFVARHLKNLRNG